MKDWNELKVKDNVLYRTTTLHEQQYDKFVAPAIVKDTILQTLHVHDDMGHQDRDRTPGLLI